MDDQIEHLRSLTDGLRQEGFSNIVEKRSVGSVNELLEGGYELIILDLGNVATEICSNDGLGVLSALKKAAPYLPVLIVTGTNPPPDVVPVLSQADLIRRKPVKSGDLAADVEEVLKLTKDPFWAAMAILRELSRLQAELTSALGIRERIILHWHKHFLIRKIRRQDESLTSNASKIGDVVLKYGSLAVQIARLAKGL